jgi:hypothetical protein
VCFCLKEKKKKRTSTNKAFRRTNKSQRAIAQRD